MYILCIFSKMCARMINKDTAARLISHRITERDRSFQQSQSFQMLVGTKPPQNSWGDFNIFQEIKNQSGRVFEYKDQEDGPVTRIIVIHRTSSYWYVQLFVEASRLNVLVNIPDSFVEVFFGTGSDRVLAQMRIIMNTQGNLAEFLRTVVGMKFQNSEVPAKEALNEIKNSLKIDQQSINLVQPNNIGQGVNPTTIVRLMPPEENIYLHWPKGDPPDMKTRANLDDQFEKLITILDRSITYNGEMLKQILDSFAKDSGSDDVSSLVDAEDMETENPSLTSEPLLDLTPEVKSDVIGALNEGRPIESVLPSNELMESLATRLTEFMEVHTAKPVNLPAESAITKFIQEEQSQLRSIGSEITSEVKTLYQDIRKYNQDTHELMALNMIKQQENFQEFYTKNVDALRESLSLYNETADNDTQKRSLELRSQLIRFAQEATTATEEYLRKARDREDQALTVHLNVLQEALANIRRDQRSDLTDITGALDSLSSKIGDIKSNPEITVQPPVVHVQTPEINVPPLDTTPIAEAIKTIRLVKPIDAADETKMRELSQIPDLIQSIKDLNSEVSSLVQSLSDSKVSSRTSPLINDDDAKEISERIRSIIAKTVDLVRSEHKVSMDEDKRNTLSKPVTNPRDTTKNVAFKPPLTPRSRGISRNPSERKTVPNIESFEDILSKITTQIGLNTGSISTTEKQISTLVLSIEQLKNAIAGMIQEERKSDAIVERINQTEHIARVKVDVDDTSISQIDSAFTLMAGRLMESLQSCQAVAGYIKTQAEEVSKVSLMWLDDENVKKAIRLFGTAVRQEQSVMQEAWFNFSQKQSDSINNLRINMTAIESESKAHLTQAYTDLIQRQGELQRKQQELLATNNSVAAKLGEALKTSESLIATISEVGNGQNGLIVELNNFMRTLPSYLTAVNQDNLVKLHAQQNDGSHFSREAVDALILKIGEISEWKKSGPSETELKLQTQVADLTRQLEDSQRSRHATDKSQSDSVLERKISELNNQIQQLQTEQRQPRREQQEPSNRDQLAEIQQLRKEIDILKNSPVVHNQRQMSDEQLNNMIDRIAQVTTKSASTGDQSRSQAELKEEIRLELEKKDTDNQRWGFLATALNTIAHNTQPKSANETVRVSNISDMAVAVREEFKDALNRTSLSVNAKLQTEFSKLHEELVLNFAGVVSALNQILQQLKSGVQNFQQPQPIQAPVIGAGGADMIFQPGLMIRRDQLPTMPDMSIMGPGYTVDDMLPKGTKPEHGYPKSRMEKPYKDTQRRRTRKKNIIPGSEPTPSSPVSPPKPSVVKTILDTFKISEPKAPDNLPDPVASDPGLDLSLLNLPGRSRRLPKGAPLGPKPMPVRYDPRQIDKTRKKKQRIKEGQRWTLGTRRLEEKAELKHKENSKADGVNYVLKSSGPVTETDQRILELYEEGMKRWPVTPDGPDVPEDIQESDESGPGVDTSPANSGKRKMMMCLTKFHDVCMLMDQYLKSATNDVLSLAIHSGYGTNWKVLSNPFAEKYTPSVCFYYVTVFVNHKDQITRRVVISIRIKFQRHLYDQYQDVFNYFFKDAVDNDQYINCDDCNIPSFNTECARILARYVDFVEKSDLFKLANGYPITARVISSLGDGSVSSTKVTADDSSNYDETAGVILSNMQVTPISKHSSPNDVEMIFRSELADYIRSMIRSSKLIAPSSDFVSTVVFGLYDTTNSSQEVINEVLFRVSHLIDPSRALSVIGNFKQSIRNGEIDTDSWTESMKKSFIISSVRSVPRIIEAFKKVMIQASDAAITMVTDTPNENSITDPGILSGTANSEQFLFDIIQSETKTSDFISNTANRINRDFKNVMKLPTNVENSLKRARNKNDIALIQHYSALFVYVIPTYNDINIDTVAEFYHRNYTIEWYKVSTCTTLASSITTVIQNIQTNEKLYIKDVHYCLSKYIYGGYDDDFRVAVTMNTNIPATKIELTYKVLENIEDLKSKMAEYNFQPIQDITPIEKGRTTHLENLRGVLKRNENDFIMDTDLNDTPDTIETDTGDTPGDTPGVYPADLQDAIDKLVDYGNSINIDRKNQEELNQLAVDFRNDVINEVEALRRYEHFFNNINKRDELDKNQDFRSFDSQFLESDEEQSGDDDEKIGDGLKGGGIDNIEAGKRKRNVNDNDERSSTKKQKGGSLSSRTRTMQESASEFGYAGTINPIPKIKQEFRKKLKIQKLSIKNGNDRPEMKEARDEVFQRANDRFTSKQSFVAFFDAAVRAASVQAITVSQFYDWIEHEEDDSDDEMSTNRGNVLHSQLPPGVAPTGYSKPIPPRASGKPAKNLNYINVNPAAKTRGKGLDGKESSLFQWATIS